MGLTGFVKGKIIGTIVDKLAQSEPRTTLAGAALASIVAANIDYNKLVQGDSQQIGNAVAAVIVVLLGYWTNHKSLAGGGNAQAPKP